MKIKIGDLEHAFLFASVGSGMDVGAYLDRETGQFRYTGLDLGAPDDTADALAGSDRYLPVPNKCDLDLGQALVFEFVADQFPEGEERVRELFQHRGAYTRFKDLLDDRNLLNAWYDYEHRKTLEALRDWAEGHGVELVD